MTFDEIRLTRAEKAVLKRSRKIKIPKAKCERLLRLNLVEEIMDQRKAGYALVSSGWCEIAPLGVDYLEYISARGKEKTAEWVRYIITTVIAVVALIISIIALTAELCSPVFQLP